MYSKTYCNETTSISKHALNWITPQDHNLVYTSILIKYLLLMLQRLMGDEYIKEEFVLSGKLVLKNRLLTITISIHCNKF